MNAVARPAVLALLSSVAVGACVPNARPAQYVDRSAPPTLAAPTPVVMPPTVERILPNGLRLVVVSQNKLPMLDAVLVFQHGSEADPAGKAGVASLTASLLREGTNTRSSPDIADQQAFLGIRIGSSSSLEQTTISLHTPTAVLDSALALMGDLALRPTFPEAAFSRVKSETLTGLLQLRDRAPAIADRAFASLVYGDDHPYGRPASGTEQTVDAITREDVLAFYRTWYRPNVATLVLVGDITADDAERRARVLFGAWERANVPSIAMRDVPAGSATTISLIDKPGAPQSSFRLGSVGVTRNTPDYYALTVLNTVLGGSFTSRLNNNLRETKGYTYGAGSAFAMRRAAGPFAARAEIVAEKSDSALIEFMKELRAIRENVPADELEKARQYLILGFAQRFETTGDVAAELTPLITYGLPLDTWAGFQRGIESVTSEDLARVAKQYVDPSRMHIIIVGDRASIEAKLRATNLAPIQIRDLQARNVPTP